MRPLDNETIREAGEPYLTDEQLRGDVLNGLETLAGAQRLSVVAASSVHEAPPERTVGGDLAGQRSPEDEALFKSGALSKAHDEFKEMQARLGVVGPLPHERRVRSGGEGELVGGTSQRERPLAFDPNSVRPMWDLPQLANDRVAGPIAAARDALDVSGAALRFAKLLAAKEVEPPIAVGLFGSWGSGKTFFMGLIQGHVDALTALGSADYVARVVPIEFNAWHYQDANLWASVATRIFDGLATALAPSPSEVDRKRRELHQTIASSRERRADADARRQLTVERRYVVGRELEQNVFERDRKVSESAAMQFKAAWEILKSQPDVKTLAESVASAAVSMGIECGKTSGGGPNQLTGDDVVRLKSQMESTWKKGHGLVASVSARFRGPRALLSIAALLLVLFAASVAGWGFDALFARLKGGRATLPGAAVIAQVTTLLSAAVAWVSQMLHRASDGIERVARLDREIQSKARQIALEWQSSLGNAPDQELRAEIAELDAKVRRAVEEVQQADRIIAEASAELLHIDHGGLVYDFLRERTSSKDYIGNLGLISMIRRDLEGLRERLEDFKKNGERPVERIVLYIDDLDRCQPAKVVEVLQAVHLLLAFDLFHVVVGVDSRWLRRSLEDTYVVRGGGIYDDEFSSHDYLEKIFQVPYTLAPLENRSFKKLVDTMIQTRSEWAQEHAEALSGLSQKSVGAGPRGDGGTAKARIPLQPIGESSKLQSASSVVFFEDFEQSFIQELHRFIDRPRLAGRFINIYRMLRARAVDDSEDATFASSADAIDYRAALVLLAINVGYPWGSRLLFRGLLAVPESMTWPGYLEHLRAAVDAFETRVSSPNSKGAVAALGDDVRVRSEADDLLRALGSLNVEMPQELSAYKRWAPRVACFSFDCGTRTHEVKWSKDVEPPRLQLS